MVENYCRLVKKSKYWNIRSTVNKKRESQVSALYYTLYVGILYEAGTTGIFYDFFHKLFQFSRNLGLVDTL